MVVSTVASQQEGSWFESVLYTNWGLSVGSLHVLPLHVWIRSRYPASSHRPNIYSLGYLGILTLPGSVWPLFVSVWLCDGLVTHP